MRTQAVNPLLPEGEYVPDGEPYVFGDRVYLYGSHDRYGAPIFCVSDYVCWSAPVDDLGAWRYEGVIYRRTQDPRNRFGLRLLFAPDVAVGPDGRFYLYYAFDFMGIMGVAVADSPTGPFEFHGHVHHPDGRLWGRVRGDSLPFDPAVLVDEDGRVYLYSGFATPVPAIATGGVKLKNPGGVVLELEPDMVTIREPEQVLFPLTGPGSFPGHEFFEASSIRRYDDLYYFVYSSKLNHELCWAVSSLPVGPFRFGGTLVDLGDLGLPGSPGEDGVESKGRNYLGNTHGGLLRIRGEFFIFYHRHTNRSSYARQACAERLVRRPDGGFDQVEVTSRGLNDGPLDAIGVIPAAIACGLRSADGVGRYDEPHPRRLFASHPYIAQDAKDRGVGPDGTPGVRQHIANMRDGALAAFKDFDFSAAGVRAIRAVIRGEAEGEILVATNEEGTGVFASIPVHATPGSWRSARAEIAEAPAGVRSLFLIFRGTGAIDLLEFELEGERR